MAAELLSAAGRSITVYERMPSVARKLLIAGRGGLNLTHSEPLDRFVARYGGAAVMLRPILEAFPPQALIDWAEGLGQPTFAGTSGRVFPKAMKASPLLRAWLARLASQGVAIKTRHEWRGWDERGRLVFDRAGAVVVADADATILALGGASWPRLGSNGAWAGILDARGVRLTPLLPSNCGFTTDWSEPFRRFEGEPLKGIALTFAGQTARGEATITRGGIEGGAIYALSAPVRDAIMRDGRAIVAVDLRPDMRLADVAAKLARPRGSDSLSNYLRKALALAPVAISLLREAHGAALSTDPRTLAAQIKSAPLTLTGISPIERAISTSGGVPFEALDEKLMLRAVPGVYAVGEMLDWEAPTGGYLLQATFATAVHVARALLR